MLDLSSSKKFLFGGILFLALFFGSHSFASETIGTIDVDDKYAWGENLGWINFGCDLCDVEVTDAGITGNAWSSQYGWINLDPTMSGVINDAEGTLSGFAWGSNIGWIDFSGVTINSSGEFLGYATVNSDSSEINFNCINGGSCASADFKVKTDWRPASGRAVPAGEVLSSGSAPSPSVLPPVVPPVDPLIPLVPPPSPPVPPPTTPTPPASNVVTNIIDAIRDFFGGDSLPDFTVEISETAPFALGGTWNLMPVSAISSFVFAPLPYEIRILASKFPQLDRTLKSVGIERFTDVSKLSGVSLNIPGLADKLDQTIRNIGLEKLTDIDGISGVALDIPGLSGLDEKLITGLGSGQLSLIPGLPVSRFPVIAKQDLPAEFVFARTQRELIDLNVSMSVGERGQVVQSISTLPGKTLKLVVKPISAAESVTGHFIFRSATPRVVEVENAVARSSLTASAIFALNDVETITEPIAQNLQVENLLVVSSFEYTDPDGDGIYTAEVTTPVVPGEYEIITVINYTDPVLGTRQMRMITVIDPEGYVFEESGGKETRIPSAIVSLYRLNSQTKAYELWNAEDYSQENPQITDVRGTYSFLVPEGTYYFQVEAPGYNTHQGKVFDVREGSGIHQNIEMKSGSAFLPDLDPQTILLIVVLLLLVYNLYRTNLRDKLKFLNKENGQ